MDIKILHKSALLKWVDRLKQREFTIVGPVSKHGSYVFDEITDPSVLTLDYTQTVAPPKKYLLPPHEVLFNFNTKSFEMEADFEAEPTVILGVHTCDMHAIQLLDKIQATGFADQHYQARRENLYLVSIECMQPCNPNSFCKSMETFSIPENYDVHLIDLGEVYAVSIGSEKGEELFDGCTNLWEATEADNDLLNQVMSDKWGNFEFRLACDLYELPEILEASTHSLIWDEIGDKCLACGACTQVCPTCYCFDVTDEIDLTLTNGQRVRTWDSCQIERFAVVAGGHNFRTSLGRRARHRFMRKGKYQYEAYGQMGCVGCGRCAMSCQVKINCVDTFNALYREYKGEAEATQEEVPS